MVPSFLSWSRFFRVAFLTSTKLMTNGDKISIWRLKIQNKAGNHWRHTEGFPSHELRRRGLGQSLLRPPASWPLPTCLCYTKQIHHSVRIRPLASPSPLLHALVHSAMPFLPFSVDLIPISPLKLPKCPFLETTPHMLLRQAVFVSGFNTVSRLYTPMPACLCSPGKARILPAYLWSHPTPLLSTSWCSGLWGKTDLGGNVLKKQVT